jgi:hypothetical protein
MARNRAEKPAAPGLDDHLVEPEVTRARHSKLFDVLQSHVALGYRVAVLLDDAIADNEVAEALAAKGNPVIRKLDRRGGLKAILVPVKCLRGLEGLPPPRRRPHRGFPPKRGVSTFCGDLGDGGTASGHPRYGFVKYSSPAAARRYTPAGSGARRRGNRAPSR